MSFEISCYAKPLSGVCLITCDKYPQYAALISDSYLHEFYANAIDAWHKDNDGEPTSDDLAQGVSQQLIVAFHLATLSDELIECAVSGDILWCIEYEDDDFFVELYEEAKKLLSEEDVTTKTIH